LQTLNSHPRKKNLLKNNRGQILVEYLLLMVIAIGCATLLVTKLVSRNEARPGIIVKTWSKLIQDIGHDVPDCSKQTDFSTANCPQ